MSVINEIRNTYPNHNDKCELVINNPCFDNRFYSIDTLSLNSFSEYENLVETQCNITNNQKSSPENDENTFMKRFSIINKSNHSIATLKAAQFITNEDVQTSKTILKKLPPLHSACYSGQIDQIKKLIEKDQYDPMKHDQNGYLPIHYATMNNQIESLKLLLNIYGCQPNAQDLKDGMTCLHHACQLGLIEIVKLLINHPDIDLICIDSQKRTCLNLCEKNYTKANYKECTELIKQKLSQPYRQIYVKLMDGSGLYLDLISGSNTTVDQLKLQIDKKIGLDQENSKFFAFWICSKHLKLQLKNDHKPLQHLAEWKRQVVPKLTICDPLKEEPSLILMRDARIVVKDELKVNNLIAIRLLCFEAYHNYIHSMYACTEQDAVKLSVIFMKILNESFKAAHWKEFLISNDNNLRMLLPAKLCINKPSQEWIKLISSEFESSHSQLASLSQAKLQFRFLSHCWNLPNYGSAIFQASIASSNGKFKFVHVCVNGNGIHLLNKQTRTLELFYSYKEIIWRVHHSPDSIEIYSKRTNQSLFLYTKQNNLINHLMYILESQMNKN